MDYRAFQKFNYGVYIITSLDGDKNVGFTANAAMQITSDPVTIAISVNHENYTNECIKKSGKFAINVLSETSKPKLIGTFGFFSSKDKDKFAGVDIKEVDGLAILNDACSYVTCEVIDKMEAPTHTIFLGKVISAGIDTCNCGHQMSYEYYHTELRGKSPKKAAAYIPPEKLEESENK